MFFVLGVLKHLDFLIFGEECLDFYPIFILYYDIPNTNLHTKLRKNPSMFVESKNDVRKVAQK